MPRHLPVRVVLLVEQDSANSECLVSKNCGDDTENLLRLCKIAKRRHVEQIANTTATIFGRNVVFNNFDQRRHGLVIEQPSLKGESIDFKL